MGFIKEFKEFAATGNFIDLAVGVVMGAAVGKVVSAFIEGMVMPAVGMISGVDFSKAVLTLKEAVTDASGKITSEAVTVKYGAFISSFIDFLLVALVVFVVIKALNKLKKKKAEAAPAGPSSTDALLMEIRDALKK
ncbi:MAG: large-conductance mechanosensitive channel protein MscL [Ferruginibacter sp.]